MSLPVVPPGRVVLYGGEGCHLCEDAHAVVVAHLDARRAAGRPGAELVVMDIHRDEGLTRLFMETIPVLAAGDSLLPLATSPARIRAFLDAALDAPAPTASAGGVVASPAGDAR